MCSRRRVTDLGTWRGGRFFMNAIVHRRNGEPNDAFGSTLRPPTSHIRGALGAPHREHFSAGDSHVSRTTVTKILLTQHSAESSPGEPAISARTLESNRRNANCANRRGHQIRATSEKGKQKLRHVEARTCGEFSSPPREAVRVPEGRTH